MISRRLSSELNLFRWLAAFMVLISHLRNMLFVEYGELVSKTVPIKLLYFFTGFGHEAVVVFFVISGLLVGGTAIDRYRNGRFDPADFAIHRFSRIYIVLIPALIACALLDHVGLAYFNGSLVYSHPTQANFHRVFADHMDWITALGNVSMLQHMAVDVLGSDAPLWSLSYEWWYYTLFFVAVGGMLTSASIVLRTLSGIALGLMLYWLPAEPVAWFAIWLLGAAIGFSPLRRVRIKPWIAYLLLLMALVWSRFDHTYTTSPSIYVNFRRDAIVAAGCFLLFTALNQREAGTVVAEKFHRTMAEFSYTVYLVHVPFIVFAAALLDTWFGIPFYRQPTLAGGAYFVWLLTGAYLYSYAFSRLTERHTNRLRQGLRAAWREVAARRVIASAADTSMTARTAED